ncbi:MAG: hypothetical protein M1818_006605 [Claussenomyces sp. TS43310]|nr:MAG: hypothetical protein M1818_006960 [Claussenomyces sp. TS43310]KAI9735028.1 MAG: hypothetical protein M1818_006605 [Claussenomyces sp. TS43310]
MNEQEPAILQERLYALSQTISCQPGLATKFISSVTGELREICQSVNEKERKFLYEHRQLAMEREQVQTQLRENQRLLSNALAERDRACRDRDDSIRELAEQKLQRQSLERSREVEKTLKQLNIELQETVRIQEQQLAGKRSVWLENHPSSGARRSAQKPRDPFTTPSGNHDQGRRLRRSSGDVSSVRNLHAQFQQMQLNERPPASADGEGNLLSALIPMKVMSYSICSDNGSVDGSVTPPDQSSMAIIPFKSEDQVADEFVDGIGKCWNLVESWARSYANFPNEVAVDQCISENRELWQQMLSLTYPNPQDAHNHVMLLLRDQGSRCFFVMRMIVHYICNSMWDLSDWEGHDFRTTRKIQSAAKRLKIKGLNPPERAEAVAMQTSAVQSIVSDDDFLAYRAHRLSQHTKELRGLLGPLLNKNVARADAGRDIGGMTVHAFDLSVRMHTSGWSFQFIFPECASKFGSTSMICRDSSITDTPLDLQIRQARLKLVITPVVTMRDDRGLSIRVKQLHCANVLTMG